MSRGRLARAGGVDGVGRSSDGFKIVWLRAAAHTPPHPASPTKQAHVTPAGRGQVSFGILGTCPPAVPAWLVSWPLNSARCRMGREGTASVCSKGACDRAHC
jgi:hypothetical protein